MADSFAAALVRHSREVARLEGDQADEFLRLLNDTRESLLGRLSGIGSGSSLDAFRLREILAQTESAIGLLEAKAAGQYQTGAKDAAELSIAHTVEEIERLSKTFDARPLNVSIDAQAVLADPAQGLLANHFQSSVKRYGLEVLNGVRRDLFIGLRTGDQVGEIVKKIAGTKGPLGTFSRSAGERLVRTEVSQAYGSAQHSSAKEAATQIPGLRKVWLHTSSYICSVCGPLHGTERPLDGTWSVKVGKKIREVAHPPIHPNDTCRISTMKPSWRAGLQKLGYLEKQEDEPGSL